jgi:ribosomal protein S18 acetylase RimI-like enzyme
MDGRRVAVEGTADRFEPAVELPDIPGLAFRHVHAPNDYPGMNAVANANRVADGDLFAVSLENLVNHYEHLSNSDPARDVLIVEIGGSIVGYARCAWFSEFGGDLIYETVCFLHPDWHRRGLGRAMLAAIEARIRQIAAGQPHDGPRLLQAEANDAAPGREALLRSAGFTPARHGYTMIRPTLDDQPDAPLPDGLEIREVRPEHMAAIWDADQEAFRDHWGSGQWTEEDYQRFLTDPTQGDTTLWRIAWDGDQVAGQVRSFINAEENRQFGRRRGWVENISVRRPWRHRGLARALMAASFPLLRVRGMTEGALTVDTENLSGALRVYESVGFRPVERSTTYRRPLD